MKLHYATSEFFHSMFMMDKIIKMTRGTMTTLWSQNELNIASELKMNF